MSQIFLWRYNDKALRGMAFIDTETYIHQAVSVKNFILIADINRSVQLLCYKVKGPHDRHVTCDE